VSTLYGREGGGKGRGAHMASASVSALTSLIAKSVCHVCMNMSRYARATLGSSSHPKIPRSSWNPLKPATTPTGHAQTLRRRTGDALPAGTAKGGPGRRRRDQGRIARRVD
jgi:hypothetical protein